MKKLAEGKTKIIRRENPGIVLVENKDILSKEDGAVLYPLPGKGICATETTCNVFELLKRYNVPMAYVEKVDERTFRTYEADMIKIEVVGRNLPFGSRLKRHPEEKGIIEYFDSPVIELFYKDDGEGDPFMVYDIISGHWLLFNAKMPMKEGFLREMHSLRTKEHMLVTESDIKEMVNIANKVITVLTEAWKKLNVILVDIKLEFGYIRVNGKLVLALADVIDNDSWRIWLWDGSKYKMKDKEVFRMLKEIKPEDRDKLKENYQWVAEATKKFLA